ncbi:MAG: lipase family alpha/beta hydrolase [Candidatus Nanohaloarchaea archaeon]
MSTNPFSKLLDLQVQALKTGASAAKEPYRDRTSDEDLPFRTEGYGGFGGDDYFDTEGEPEDPVILSHGLARGADDMDGLAHHLLENGYTGSEVYAIEYGDPMPSLEDGAEQLHSFIRSVRDHTGEEPAVVGHSNGGLIPRYMMDRYGDEDVEKLVAVSSPNHGSIWSDIWTAAGTDQNQISRRSAREGVLSELNDKDLDTEIYTVRGTHDGSYLDPESPALEDALNVKVRGGHDIQSHEAVLKILEADGPEKAVESLEKMEEVLEAEGKP